MDEKHGECEFSTCRVLCHITSLLSSLYRPAVPLIHKSDSRARHSTAASEVSCVHIWFIISSQLNSIESTKENQTFAMPTVASIYQNISDRFCLTQQKYKSIEGHYRRTGTIASIDLDGNFPG